MHAGQLVVDIAFDLRQREGILFADEAGGVIGAAILINLLFAALAGLIVPLVLDRMGIDPALAGGVILTTVTDVIGFFAFLGLATVVL